MAKDESRRILVFLWMVLIFYLLHQSSIESNELSIGITEKIIGIVDKAILNTINTNIRNLNCIIRKYAHLFDYLVLGILIFNGLKGSGITGGRGGQVKDGIIDSAGSTVGLVLYLLIRRFYMKNRQYARN